MNIYKNSNSKNIILIYFYKYEWIITTYNFFGCLDTMKSEPWNKIFFRKTIFFVSFIFLHLIKIFMYVFYSAQSLLYSKGNQIYFDLTSRPLRRRLSLHKSDGRIHQDRWDKKTDIKRLSEIYSFLLSKLTRNLNQFKLFIFRNMI